MSYKKERDFLSNRRRSYEARLTASFDWWPGSKARTEIQGSGSFSSTERLLSREERERKKLTQKILTTYSGLDRYLQAKSDGKDFIIDMYLVPSVETEPIDPEEALKQLRSHINSIDKIGLDKLPPEWSVARDNLVAVITFLREKMKRNGEKTPYEEYVYEVSGVKPILIPEEELQTNKSEFLKLLHDTGARFDDYNEESIRKAFQEYQARSRIFSRRDVEHGIERFDSRLRHEVGNILKGDLRDLNYRFRWKEVDAPWMCWERVEPNGFYLDMNWHPTKQKEWTWGATERYALHEVAGHFIMGYLQSQEIRQGKVDSVVGYLLIPGPGSWALEGVAQTLDSLADLELTLDGKLSVAQYRMYVRARTNALYKLEKGEPMEQVVSEVVKYAPSKTQEELENELKQGLMDPLWRAYLPIYGLSDFDMMRLADNLGNGMKNVILPQIFRRPMNRNQLLELDMEALLGYPGIPDFYRA